MIRDVSRLRAAARLVDADLRRTLGSEWGCVVDDSLVLTIGDGARSESVALVRDVEDEDWYVNAAWSAAEQSAALDVDATEAVASAALEVLALFGGLRLTCADCGAGLEACELDWYCTGDDGHAGAIIGQLGMPPASEGEGATS